MRCNSLKTPKLNTPRAEALYAEIDYRRRALTNSLTEARTEAQVLGTEAKEKLSWRRFVSKEFAVPQLAEAVRSHPLPLLAGAAIVGYLSFRSPSRPASLGQRPGAFVSHSPSLKESISEEFGETARAGLHKMFDLVRKYVGNTLDNLEPPHNGHRQTSNGFVGSDPF